MLFLAVAFSVSLSLFGSLLVSSTTSVHAIITIYSEKPNNFLHRIVFYYVRQSSGGATKIAQVLYFVDKWSHTNQNIKMAWRHFHSPALTHTTETDRHRKRAKYKKKKEKKEEANMKDRPQPYNNNVCVLALFSPSHWTI